ncbi:MAG: prohibitin family protein [Desulfobacteraceae bacterium]|nr:prohibitin family protein [Desulfobacteraceae bacterium]
MKKFLKRHLEFFIVFGLVFLFALFFLWNSIVITIYPGHAGVYFRRLFNKGTITEKYYGEGVHFIFPWNKMYIYDVRIQELKQTVEVLSQNGLTIQVAVSVRYYLLKDQVPMLHQTVGESYREKVIIPSTISSVREVIGKYLPEELYTTARHVIQDEILVEAVEETGRLPIIYADMIIVLIKLPDMINRAIETKLRHQQEYLQYQFQILKAGEEKKRKIIEASGIQQYQLIIAKSLSEPLLKWQGIQATKDISKSENSKIIIIGGKDGLPVILNTETTPKAKLKTSKPKLKATQPEQNAGKIKKASEIEQVAPKNKAATPPQDKKATTKKDELGALQKSSKKVYDAIKAANNKLSQNPLEIAFGQKKQKE